MRSENVVSPVTSRLGRKKLIALGVVAAVAIAAAAVIAITNRSSDGSSLRPIRVGAVLSPRTPLFGDTVTARVEFAGDARRVVPGSIKVEGQFRPYRLVATPSLERKSAGGTEYVVWTARLRCLASSCLTGKPERRVIFPPVLVTYSLRTGDQNMARSVAVRWPPLLVYSRVDPIEVEATDPRDEPLWRADLASLLNVSYRIPPGASATVLYGAGGALILGVLALVLPLRRREVDHPVAEPSSALTPQTPLEYALALLEGRFDSDGTFEQSRAALEFIAIEMGRRGEGELERSARRLAWSQEPPVSESTVELARLARGVTETRSNGGSA